MEFILFDDDPDPGMRYEGLARYAFDCNAWGGPGNIAHQSVYNNLFVPETNKEGLQVLNQIIDALINKFDGDKKNEFIELKNSLSNGMGQLTAIRLINLLIKIIKE